MSIRRAASEYTANDSASVGREWRAADALRRVVAVRRHRQATDLRARRRSENAPPPTAMPAEERIPVLMYHRIGPTEGHAEARYCVTPDRFAAHMSLLAVAGSRPCRWARWPRLAGRRACTGPGDFVLTFDDGFLGVREHALPVLERLGWPFTVFLVTDLLGGVDAWKHSDGAASGQHLLLSADDVLAMRERGCSFHSHTRRHVSLPGWTTPP